MFEIYNQKIIKFIKLLTMVISSYYVLTYSQEPMEKENAVKSALIIGIIFMILDGYYPTVNNDEHLNKN